MITTKNVLLLIAGLVFVFAFKKIMGFQGGPDTWTQSQLIEPAELAKEISPTNSAGVIIYNIGPSGLIKGAIDIGPTQEKENLDKLKLELSKLPKEKKVVVYCGCCPFKNCPNIRPAFKMLNEMKFSNSKLLNLSENLKVDWINKGFPMTN